MLESKKKLLNEVNFRNAITRNLLSRHSRHFHDKSKHLGVGTSRILKQNLSCIRKMLYNMVTTYVYTVSCTLTLLRVYPGVKLWIRKNKRRIEKTRKALCEWWNPRESIRYYEVMESNEHDLRESAQGACLRGPRATLVGPRALSITRRRARGNSLCFPPDPTTNLIVLPAFE